MALLLMTSLKFHYYRNILQIVISKCLSETFLNSSLDRDDDRLKIEGYNLIGLDDPSGLKKGGVCIYYKEHIPLIRRDDLCSLRNCLVAEIRLENEKCFYRSPRKVLLLVSTDHLEKCFYLSLPLTQSKSTRV